jgi:regulator of ribosome biosynthesis
MTKNIKQQAQNIARAQSDGGSSKDQRKLEISRTLATTRVSTASMGKFDKRMDGEKKLKGVKRKVNFVHQ